MALPFGQRLAAKRGGAARQHRRRGGAAKEGERAMIRKFLRALVMIPAAVMLGFLAMANRQPVTVSFDPFDGSDTDFTMTVPLYVLGFTILIAGVVVGGFAAWLRQRRRRRLVSRLAAENVVIRSELASLQGKASRRSHSLASVHRAG
jgi:uncharacterized integral membrane protein